MNDELRPESSVNSSETTEYSATGSAEHATDIQDSTSEHRHTTAAADTQATGILTGTVIWPVQQNADDHGKSYSIDQERVDTRYDASAADIIQLSTPDVQKMVLVGDDLYLVKSNGSLVLIENGASNVPTLIMGGRTLAQDTLKAVIDGSYETSLKDGGYKDGVESHEEGGGVLTAAIENIGDNLPLTPLLDPTELVFRDPPDLPPGGGGGNPPPPNGLPTAGQIMLLSDDDDLGAGNMDADMMTPGDEDPVNLMGTLPFDFGPDGPGSIDFSPMNGVIAPFTSAGLTVTYQWDPGTNTLSAVRSDTQVVFTMQVNPTTGDYVFVQNLQVDNHPVAAADNTEVQNVFFTLTYQVTDSNGDMAFGTVNGVFDDDVPLAEIMRGDGSVTIDETEGLQDGSMPNTDTGGDNNDNDVAGPLPIFAAVANPGFDPDMSTQYAVSNSPVVTGSGTSGGDSEGATTVLSLNILDANSGLTTTEGDPIALVQEGDLIVGRVQSGPNIGKAAFAISIDQTGVVSVVQYLSLANPIPGASYDEPVDLTGKIEAVVTVMDGDGDIATASLPIGAAVIFEDDGPFVDVTLADVELPKLALDETIANEILGLDRYAMGEMESDPNLVNGAVDDTGSSASDPTGTTPFGLVTGQTSQLFDTSMMDPGSDGTKSSTEVYSISVTNATSGLSVTDTATDGIDINDPAITWVQVSSTVIEGRFDITGGAVNEGVALRITINDMTGEVTVEQFMPIAHGNTTLFDEEISPNSNTISVTLTKTLVDGDDDTASDFATRDLSPAITIDDDGPVLLNTMVMGIVDEDDLNTNLSLGTSPDDGDGDGSVTNADGSASPNNAAADSADSEISMGVTQISLNGLVDFGTDGNGGFMFKDNLAGTDLGVSSGIYRDMYGDPVLDMNGDVQGIPVGIAQVTMNMDGSTTLVAKADDNGNSMFDGRTIFTVTIAADGTLTYQLYDQLNQGDPGIGEMGDPVQDILELDLSSYILAKDGDGDSIMLGTGQVVIKVRDDVPNDFEPDDIILVNTGTDMDTALLDYFGNVGADEVGTVVWTGGTDGDLLQGTVGTGSLGNLTSGGENIVLNGFGTTTLVGTRETGGETVFTATLMPDGTVQTDDVYKIDFDLPIDAGGGITFDSFANVSAGNPQWFPVQGVNDFDLLITPIPNMDPPMGQATTVNNSSFDIANSNQWIGTGEGIRLDYVNNVTNQPGMDEGDEDGFQFDGHYSGTTGQVSIMQVQSNTDTTVSIQACFVDDMMNTETPVTITEIRVDTYDGETLTFDVSGLTMNGDSMTMMAADGDNYTVTFQNDTFEISGLEAPSGSDVGDIIQFDTSSPFNAVKVNYVDDDFFSVGNFSLGNIALDEPVDFDLQAKLTDEDGDNAPDDAEIINVTLLPEATTTIVDDIMTNNLVGTSADEFFLGREGSDSMTGNGGADTFIIDASSLQAGIVDIITDYGTDDFVDLTQLFDIDPNDPDKDQVSDFVNIVDNGAGVDDDLQIDADGGADNFVTVATLDADAGVNVITDVENGTTSSSLVT